MKGGPFDKLQQDLQEGGFKAVRQRFWRQTKVLFPFFLLAVVPLFLTFLYTHEPTWLLALLAVTLIYGWWRRDAL